MRLLQSSTNLGLARGWDYCGMRYRTVVYVFVGARRRRAPTCRAFRSNLSGRESEG